MSVDLQEAINALQKTTRAEIVADYMTSGQGLYNAGEALVSFGAVLELFSSHVHISKKRMLKEWRTWNVLAKTMRFQVVMNQDDYVMVKSAQEIRNAIVRLLFGEFTGKDFLVTEKEVEELLETKK